MKSFFQKAVKTIAFLACLLALLYAFSCIFSFKYEDGITTIDNFYDLPEDTVDVLLLGSSHMGMNVDPSQLWDLRGIAAYNCWGSMQQPWNTYYYLKECLKYQSPKLVVMDVYGVTFSGDFPGYDNLVKNTSGLRFSRDKIENILVSTPEEYRSALLLQIPTYHYRYSEISGADFENFFWNKHTDIQTIDMSGASIQSFDILDVSGIHDAIPLAEKCETYFRMILDTCKEKDIPLLLVASPYYLHEEEQQRFNRIGQIAEDYGYPFLNFNENYRELGLDPHEDYHDLAHLAQSGIDKYDAYLADYISAHYDLPDRRLDDSHIWNQKSETDTHCIYALENKFYGGGHNYFDTGLQLYKNPYASYTLLAQINTECISEDQVWFSCFQEGEDLEGVLLTRADGNLYLILNQGLRIEIADYGKTMKLGLVKEGLHYSAYIDGQYLRSIDVAPSGSLDQTLLLGCQLHEDGSLFRFSSTEIDNLEIYDIALNEKEIALWDPDELPEPPQRQTQSADSSAAFSLNEQFTGNGYSSYLDTGIAPYADPNASWTLLTQFEEDCSVGAGVYFSCFAEDVHDYRGVMARRIGPGLVNLLYGNRGINVEVPVDSEVTLAIVKDQSEYTIYVNGTPVAEHEHLETHPWEGNLLLACQETTEFEKMRFSGVTLYNFEFYNGVMSEEEVLAWAPEHRPAPAPVVPSPVDYTMPYAFLGNGKNEYIDTGVQLYDVPDKDWTLSMKFRKNGAQTLATCFAEDPSYYRGLIISTLDDKTLNLTLGQNGMEFELPPQPEHSLRIEKRGTEYNVWLNDTLVRTVSSLAPAYDGTLHIGCAVDGNGNLFRFSSAMILEFSVTGSEE